MIKLGKACSQLSAAAARAGYHYQRFCNLYVWIGTVAFLTYNSLHICRITLCIEMLIGFDVASLQLVDKHIYSRCVLISCYYNAVNLQIVFSENVNKSENL